jgi:membrane protein
MSLSADSKGAGPGPQRLMNVRTLLWVTARAFKSAFADNCFNISKSAAFSAILSLFPGLLLFSVLLLRGNGGEAAADIATALGQVAPPRIRSLLAEYLSVPEQHSTGWLWGAAVVTVLGASQWMVSLMEAFRGAYRLPRSWSFWKEQGVAIALVFLAALPLTVATGLMIFGRHLENQLVLEIGQPAWLVMLVVAIRFLLAIATITLVLGILYHVGPNRSQSWLDVLPGALFATLLWFVSTLLFSLYVQHGARYSDIYGSVATFIVLLVWLYLLSMIVTIGCEFNAERERLRAALAWETAQSAAPGPAQSGAAS